MTKSHSLSRPLCVKRARQPLEGILCVPGDKSISHRALMFAALAHGKTCITGLLEGEDVLRTVAAMRALGAEVTRDETQKWYVIGRGIGSLQEPDDILDMGNSGTAARLLCGVLATHGITSVLSGDASLRKRPMKRVMAPLAQTGATFLSREGGLLPLAIQGNAHPNPLFYRLPVASAQVKSAVLLAGLNADGETCVEEPIATRDHTENMLQHFGAVLEIEKMSASGRIIRLNGPARLIARDVIVPGDFSSAVFPLVAALLVPDSKIQIKGIGLNPLRTGALTTLLEMGGMITVTNTYTEEGEFVGDVSVVASELHGVNVPSDRVPSMIDEYPILAVAAAYAYGVSRFRGLEELRVKESDRLSAVVSMLDQNGVCVEVEDNDLIIYGTGGNIPGGGHVETRMDHRLAMSASILGLVATQQVHIDDTSFIDTSFPGYLSLMNSIGAGFEI